MIFPSFYTGEKNKLPNFSLELHYLYWTWMVPLLMLVYRRSDLRHRHSSRFCNWWGQSQCLLMLKGSNFIYSLVIPVKFFLAKINSKCVGKYQSGEVTLFLGLSCFRHRQLNTAGRLQRANNTPHPMLLQIHWSRRGEKF